MAYPSQKVQDDEATTDANDDVVDVDGAYEAGASVDGASRSTPNQGKYSILNSFSTSPDDDYREEEEAIYYSDQPEMELHHKLLHQQGLFQV
ncbi:hypothetical protein ACHAXH_008552 [Discostella pseudostelligera]